MLLIPDNSTLKKFIPNVLAEVHGESKLFDKVYTFLVSAEIWFCNNFIPEDILKEIVEDATDENDPLYFLPRRIVALKAWLSAMPSVDVIVGPTGVGVTETATLKPASKAKVDKLLEATAKELDFNIEWLINIIYHIPRWLDSEIADKFRQSMFPDFRLLDALGIHEDRYKNWLVYSHRASIIEKRIAVEWVSVPVMARIRGNLLSRMSKGVEKEVAEMLRGAVIEELRTGCEHRKAIEEATNIIRSDKVSFPEWHSTDTALRFNAPVFKNSKEKGGYFL